MTLKRLVLALLVLVAAFAVIGQVTTPPAGSVAIWEPGKWFPTYAKIGTGLNWDRATGTLKAEPAAMPPMPSVSVHDSVASGAAITATADGSRVAAPAGVTVVFVASQAYLYPRLTFAEYQAGGLGYALDSGSILMRPAAQGTVRVVGLTITQSQP